MKFTSSINLLLALALVVMASCKVSKKDFDPDNIEWKDVIAEWGVPVVHSNLKISDVVAKNKTPLIIEFDAADEDFISLVYLDTVRSPTGEELLRQFVKDLPFNLNNTIGNIGAILINSSNAGQTIRLDLPEATLPFEYQQVKKLSRVKLKGGILSIKATSRVKHDLVLSLKFPEIVSESGDTLQVEIPLSHQANVPISSFDFPSINLDGYVISTSAPNLLKYQISASIKVLNNDNSSLPRNPATAIDSINFKLNFRELGYKYVIGEFNPIQFSDTLNGESRFSVFNNVRQGHIVFNRPQIRFNFLNSFGAKIAANIEQAAVYYSYDTTELETFAKNLETNNLTDLRIPGTTVIDGPSISQLGTSRSTTFTLDKSNSTLADILTGAPYKLSYVVPSISLIPVDLESGFISDNSQLEIQTEVRIPLELRITRVVIADTIKNLDLPKPELVEYVEFKAGSINSIPFSIEMQALFLDSVENLIDSLIVPPYSPLIVAPGTPEEYDANNPNIIKRTSKTQNQTIIRVDNVRYKRLQKAKKMVVIGRAYTIDANGIPPKSVKFYAWQECTFLLAVKAKVRVDINDPESVIKLEK